MNKSYETLVQALGVAMVALNNVSADTQEIRDSLILAAELHEEEREAVQALLREVDAHLDYAEDEDMEEAAEKVRELFE